MSAGLDVDVFCEVLLVPDIQDSSVISVYSSSVSVVHRHNEHEPNNLTDCQQVLLGSF